MAELGITHAFNYCTLLPLTDTHMGMHTYRHIHTHTHTRIQAVFTLVYTGYSSR